MRIGIVGAVAASLLVVAGAAWAKGGKAPPQQPPAKAAMLVEVTDTSGKPIAGASVAVLDIEDGWTSWRRAVAVTDAKGVASFSTSFDPVCLLAWTNSDAGIVGGASLQRPPAAMTVTISPGLRLTGRIVGPDGKPAAGARARVRAHDPHEWHHFDADVAADGTIKLPTIPRELADEADAVLEFAATDLPLMSRNLSDCENDKPLELKFPAPRRVKGRLVGADGRPVVGGEIHTVDWINGPKAAADAKGAFDFGPLAPDVKRVFVVSQSHADVAADVPDGDGTIDLGEVKPPVGAPVVVRLKESDDRKIRRALVALATRDGFRVVVSTGAGPTFTFPRVGEGDYVLDVYVHELDGALGWRHVRRRDVRAGGDAIDVTVPSGLVVKLVDAAGKPLLIDEVRLSCEIPDREEPWAENFVSGDHGPGVAEIRFGPMPGPSTIVVTVAVKGRAPVVVRDVAIDADGCGACTATIGK